MDKIVRRNDLLKLLQVSRTTLWRLEREGTFPHAIQIGKRAQGYLESDVVAWFRERQSEAGRPESNR